MCWQKFYKHRTNMEKKNLDQTSKPQSRKHRLNRDSQRERKNILDIGNDSVIYIRIASIIIGLIFTYQAIQTPFRQIFSQQVSQIAFSLVFKLLMILLFNSKLYGILIDIRELQRELVKIKISKFPVTMYFYGMLYILNLIALLFFVDDFLVFCTLLAILYVIYMLFWQKSTPYFLTNIKETYKHNVEQKKEIEKLQNKILHTYFTGIWVKDAVNYVIIICLLSILITVTDSDSFLDDLLNVQSKHLVLSILILLSYFISEGIIWTKRLKRKYQIRYLDKNYDLIVRKLKFE